MAKWHEIEAKSFKGQTFDHELAFSYGEGIDKRIVIRVLVPDLSACYLVMSKGHIVYSGDSIDAAVKRYNEI